MSFQLNSRNILDTIEMIEKYRLDIRTVTMGISLLSCTRSTMEETCQAVYDRVTTQLPAWWRSARVLNANSVSRL